MSERTNSSIFGSPPSSPMWYGRSENNPFLEATRHFVEILKPFRCEYCGRHSDSFGDCKGCGAQIKTT